KVNGKLPVRTNGWWRLLVPHSQRRSEVLHPQLAQERQEQIPSRCPMLLGALTRQTRVARLNGVDNGLVLAHRCCRLRAQPQCQRSRAMRLVHDRLEHPGET